MDNLRGPILSLWHLPSVHPSTALSRWTLTLSAGSLQLSPPLLHLSTVPWVTGTIALCTTSGDWGKWGFFATHCMTAPSLSAVVGQLLNNSCHHIKIQIKILPTFKFTFVPWIYKQNFITIQEGKTRWILSQQRERLSWHLDLLNRYVIESIKIFAMSITSRWFISGIHKEPKKSLQLESIESLAMQELAQM